MNRIRVPGLMCAVLTAVGAWGSDVAGAGGLVAGELWVRKVQPLFDVQCVKCHGPIERKSGLELDSPEAVMRGGDEGQVVVAGEPGKSRLYTYLAEDADPHMPPKKQLSEAERGVVREWILALGNGSGAGGAGDGERGAVEYGSVREAIDGWVAEGWRRAGVRPSADVGDEAWVRRVTLDLAGRIPTVAEVARFLSMPGAERRGRWVEALLASEEHAVRMRELWDVFLMGRPRREAHEDRRRRSGWWSYLEGAFRSNRPWDLTVRDMLTGRPVNGAARGASWFLYERRNDHQAIAEAVAPVVYGVRIDCAQCHDHPLAREIHQAHYWGLVAAYNRGKNVEGGTEVSESAVGGFVNFTNLRKESQPALVTLLDGRKLEEARPGEGEKEEDRDELYVDAKARVRVPRNSRREAFAVAATTGNPRLARAFVNRMWAVLMGRGLVHPADEMTARNAPSHPELLDWLAADFEAHGYDVRRLVRGMVLSRVYALGWGEAGTGGVEHFTRALERPLSAEQLARSWRVAAGLEPGDEVLRRAVVGALPDVAPREYNATFQQAQFLTHSPELLALLRPGEGTTAGRLAGMTDAGERVREAFRVVLGREAAAGEVEGVLGLLGEREGGDAARATADLLWALMTCAEFLTMP